MSTRAGLALILTSIVATACGGGSSNPDAASGVCSDGIDNDGDELADYPADPGCDGPGDNDESNEPIAQCSDGRDNDGDGFVDYPYEPGCFHPLDNSETDDCPDGPNCPACSNDLDDDGDGLIDFPADSGCTDAGSGDEYVTNPAACGPGLTVTRLEPGNVTGQLVAGTSHLQGACGGSGAEVAYELVVPTPTVVVATTDLPATTANTVLYLRSTCGMPATELACHDDIVAGTNLKSTITASVPAGFYYLVVDSRDATGTGSYALQVDFFAGVGEPCALTSECGPGLTCRVPAGQTAMVCSNPVCSDGLDDDGDTLSDYPADPGCDGPADMTEEDDCPSGPTCPQCANGLDDDGDTFIDYPADTDCSAASQPVEGCGAEQDPVLILTAATMNGNLTGLSHDFVLSCGGSGGADRVYMVTVPAMSTIRFDTIGTVTDTVLALYPSSCMGASLGCNDDGGGFPASLLTMTPLAAGTYALVVSAYGGGTGGPFPLHTTGQIAAGGQCDGALATAGVIACGAGLTCTAGTCQ